MLLIDWFAKAHVVCDIVDDELRYSFTDDVARMDKDILHRIFSVSQRHEKALIGFFKEIDLGFAYLENPELIEDFILVEIFDDESSEDGIFNYFHDDYIFCEDDCENCCYYNDCKLNEREVI